ncbi:MAG: DUF1549 domain-containing protein [Luteolibacter sp.]|uniref:DUF1549 domain-containing protein n=1 Tax=Luteolibacter sp. TaxID=1962973 RepID=UPI00326480C9
MIPSTKNPKFRALCGVMFGFSSLASDAGEPDFVHEIVPILRENCLKCHTDGKKKAGLSMDTEGAFRAGSEDGSIVEPGHPEKSLMLERITSDDDDERMPPKGDGLDAKQVELVRAWIAAGAKWEPGFTFKKPAYDPPLRPRNPTLPAIVDGRTNPIDRIIDHYLADQKRSRPAALDDSAFLRRVHLDLTGLLPQADEVVAFLADKTPDKRERKVDALLADKTAYTEHWLTFWNDLLRNDYSGTGYIDGGRKQISGWLYQALYNNMPYDEFVRQLVAPKPESEGFANGIIWRGSVSAAQIPAMQYAQSVGQTFLGINLKCASCHDSFIDRWKLSDSYGLAAIYSDQPLEMSRCDKPLGKKAVAAWLFPELGTVDNSLPKEQRLAQLANLITSPQNGRTPRAIVNRLWQRLMGRGIVHPVDAMQTAPWSEDLLDMLASHLAQNHQDLKQTLRLICLSQAYQSKAESFEQAPQESNYVYQGPRPKRLTAEEFSDAIWQISGTAPAKFDAPIKRAPAEGAPVLTKSASWIWSDTGPVPDGVTVTFRKQLNLVKVPDAAFAVVSADNRFELWINGKQALTGTDWQNPESVSFAKFLVKGDNELVMVVKNEGSGANPAGAVFHALLKRGDQWVELVSDATWQWSAKNPQSDGRVSRSPGDWKPAAVIDPNPWGAVSAILPDQLLAMTSGKSIVRASLLKSDPLMRTLGRPNREQIVTTRPDDLTTLEAMDLNNGSILNDRLTESAQALLKMNFASSRDLANYVWRSALSRDPTPAELQLILSLLGAKPDAAVTQDFLWSVLMMPEFQIIR